MERIVAVVGCGHGQLNKIYESLDYMRRTKNIVADLVIICGDFQAVRDQQDLNCLACPPKYRQMGDFYEYYNGTKLAPYLTIIIGGNHEASNYMQELYCGGWLAPNIYYLGNCGCINWNGLRIVGISGIYSSEDYNKGFFESPPYSESTKRSIYHIKEWEIECVKKISNPIDIMITHDWPSGIAYHGDLKELYRYKKYLKNEIETNQLGCPQYSFLLSNKKPKYWFSAHHHVKFSAIVKHSDSENDITKFLALDKVLPNRDFMQILHIPVDNISNNNNLCYDIEWMAIMKRFHELCLFNSYKIDLSLFKSYNIVPNDLIIVKELMKDLNINQIPHNFVVNEESSIRHGNIQTDLFLKLLKIYHQITIPFCYTTYSDFDNPDEINLLDCENIDENKDPNELDLCENDEEVNSEIDPAEIYIDDL